MENIINKLSKMEDEDKALNWNNWSLEEKKILLDIYFIISKKETHIFNLIYSYHGCDGWEDIFRDYDNNYLKNKTTGIEIAIDEIIEQIKEDKNKK